MSYLIFAIALVLVTIFIATQLFDRSLYVSVLLCFDD